MVKSKKYVPTAGMDYIQDPELSFATILDVKRTGLGQIVTNAPSGALISPPGNRETNYYFWLGLLNFNPQFESGIPEDITVLFKI